MKEAEINGKTLLIEGFKNVNIKNIDSFLKLAKENTEGCHLQFFDSTLIAGFDHLYFAAVNAVKAFDEGYGISKDLAVEVLLYASGQHQISKAIELLGIKQDSRQIAVLIIADTRQKAFNALKKVAQLLQGEQCEKVVELTDQKIRKIRRAFDIKDPEIEATLRNSEKDALTSLLIERAALLATEA